MRQRDTLSIEDKLKIRLKYRKKKELGITTADIAEEFGKSRQTISAVLNDDSLIPLEQKHLEKDERKMANNVLAVLEGIQTKVLERFKEKLEADDVKAGDLVKAIKEVSTQLQLLAGKPTKITEEKRLNVDMNVLTSMPESKLLEYLSGESDELPTKINYEDAVEITDGGARELSAE